MIAVKNVLRDLVAYLNKSEVDALETTPVNGIIVSYQGEIKGPLTLVALPHEIAYPSKKKKEIYGTEKADYTIMLPKEVCTTLRKEGQTSTSIYYHDTNGYQIIFLKERSTLNATETGRLEKIIEKIRNQGFTNSL